MTRNSDTAARPAAPHAHHFRGALVYKNENHKTMSGNAAAKAFGLIARPRHRKTAEPTSAPVRQATVVESTPRPTADRKKAAIKESLSRIPVVWRDGGNAASRRTTTPRD